MRGGATGDPPRPRVAAARPLRTALTALAVVLGVAHGQRGAFTITDTMRGAADSLSRAAYDGTDAVVGARTAFEVERRRLDGEAADRRRRAPRPRPRGPRRGVAVADITDEAKVIGRDGKPIGDGPYFGVGFDRTDAGRRRADAVPPLRRPLGRRAGRGRHRHRDGRPRGPTGRQQRDDHHARRAARLPGRRHRALRQVKSMGTATFASSTWRGPGAVRRATASTGSSSPAATAEPAALRARPGARRSPQASVTTAAEQDRFTLDGLEQFISIIRIALLVFGGVAVLVGAFTIFNTLSITVAQRTRELGLLRMVGAERRQVLGSVLPRRCRSALAASVVGLVAGLGLAKALDAFFDSIGLALPEAGTVFGARRSSSRCCSARSSR